MEFTGILSLREVDRKYFIHSGTQEDKWVKKFLIEAWPGQELVGMSAEEWAHKSQLKVDVRVEKAGNDYIVSGSIEGNVPALCARCGDPFAVERTSKNIHVFVHKVARGSSEEIDPEEKDTGDPDYIYVSKDEVNLVQIFREQLIILESVAEAPPLEESTGKCRWCQKVCKPLETQEKDTSGALSSEFAKALDKIRKSGHF